MRIFVSALLPAALASAASAQAATLVVDSSSDANLGDCTEAAADCSLCGAINAANAAAGADLIEFAIPDGDAGFTAATAHWRIEPITALPPLAGVLEINGYSQPGAITNTLAPDQGGSNAVLKIELRGTAQQGLNGLESGLTDFNAQSVIRGLAINRFNSQMFLFGGGAHRVEGCFLGADITGEVAALTGNSLRTIGVRLQGPGAYVIGGYTPAARNLLSGVFRGGAEVGEANLIANGAAAGITVDSCARVRISRNVFCGNRGPAIDNVQGGGFVGSTPNDEGDADIGGNRLQNFPAALGIGIGDRDNPRTALCGRLSARQRRLSSDRRVL